MLAVPRTVQIVLMFIMFYIVAFFDFDSQLEHGWLTRPRLSYHIWKLIMHHKQVLPTGKKVRLALEVWLGL